MAPQLLKKIRAIRRRLHFIDFCRRGLIVAGWIGLVFALLALVSRLVTLPFEIQRVFPWIAGAASVWLIAWTLIGRRRLLEAAMAADQRLGLKERLSTAMALGAPRNPAEEAVLEDALRCAQNIRPGDSFPLRLGRPFRFAALPALMFAALWLFMPQFDLLARAEREEAEKKAVAIEARREAAKELEDLAEKFGEQQKAVERPELAEKVEREIDLLAKQLEEEKLTQEQAAAKLENLAEKMAARKEELEKKLDQVSNMETKGDGRFTQPIEKAMKQGDFKQAAKAMEELKQKLQNNELSEQEKQALQREMKAMAMKLGENTELGKQLSGAAQMMDQQQFNQALAGMEDAASSMLDMEALLAELKAMEGLEADMDARKAALCSKPGTCSKCGGACYGKEGVCSSCAGIGEWQAGDSRNRGSGSGKSGIGSGAIRPSEPGAVGFEKKRIPGQMTPGKIIARLKIPGEQTPGEIGTQFETLRVEYAQQAEDTIQRETMPLEMRSLVREYYDAIKYGGGGVDAAQPAAEKERPLLAPARE